MPSKRVAAMVGGPLLGLPTAETKGIAVDDDDAREIIAFSKSYAGKLEEVKDLVEVENKQLSEKEGQTEEQSWQKKRSKIMQRRKSVSQKSGHEMPTALMRRTTKPVLLLLQLLQEFGTKDEFGN